MDIFKQLNMLLTESEGVSKAKESDIPIHPEMETKEQGEMSAAEKILKLFQKLKAGSGGGMEEVKDSKPEIPDDIIDPMMKESPKSSKDKSFEKNKLAGWDEKSDEKIKKEVDVDNDDKDDDDEFDDFDYKKNSFGDEDNEDEMSNDDYDDRSEDEKLKDSIDDAIDSLNDAQSEQSNQDGDDGDDSGANWGDDNDGEEGQQGGQSGSQSQQNGQQGGQQSDNENGTPNSSGSTTNSNGKSETKSQKQKRLEDLKKSLESDNMRDFNDKMQEIKDTTDVPEGNDTPGGQIEKPSDESFKNDMKKAGFDDKTIGEMTKKKNINASEDYNEEEMEKLKKDVVDGLEDACKKKGGSTLASTIVKNSLKHKLNDDEWKEMVKVFLKSKSVGAGSMSSSNKGIKWGHKNHLWRDAVLPTDGPSKGTIQTIHCFVDFSGSVEQDLVYTFLGRVINLCVELKYTKVNVYGFGLNLTEPRVIDRKTLRDGTDVALSQTWDFITSQDPGPMTENFNAVAEEINRIKRKERDAVFLIFGDGYWEDMTLGPKCLKYDIMNDKYLNDICILTYYKNNKDYRFMGVINILKDIVGIKHIITTKAESLHT